MAINQGKLMEVLEALGSAPEPSTFIYEFLAAYNTPKSTITRLKQGGDRNIGERDGDVGLRQKLYFRPVEQGEDLFSEADTLSRSEVISRNQVRFVIVTDYRDFVAYDLSVNDRMECAIEDLYRHFSFFLPLVGYEKAVEHAESPADVKAAEKMGRFCDLLRQNNDLSTPEKVHELNVFMTRVLFCLFAEDTNIFRENQFTAFITSHTSSDASDAATVVRQLFQTLNQEHRPESLSAALNDFPFVNGGLFREDLSVPEFTPRARRLLLDAGSLDWSIINPDIFGSMFQAVIDPEQRGNLGQHYTSFSNIMKVLRPLFLDDLEQQLQKATGNPKKLERLLQRIRDIRVFDPACGSGNFLIVAYKQLRDFEMRVLDALNECDPQGEMIMPGIHLSNFYGIEIDDFAHETAQLSLWLAEHQMNQAFLDRFGHYEPTLPLKAGGNITLGNSLYLDWDRVCPKEANAEIYVCGNPPFNGANSRTEEQNEAMAHVFTGFRTYKYLDFVACWFWKGAQYIAGSNVELGLVATNSICQGMQTSMLWPPILQKGVQIRFAYQGFQWKNSARDNAGVHVSVIGLSSKQNIQKHLYKRVNGEWHREDVTNISPYLLEAGNTVVKNRSSPILGNASKPIVRGNQPTDGGYLLLSPREKDELVERDPKAERWLKRLLGADEFMKGKERWCLWLVDATDEDIDAMPEVRERVEKARQTRLNSRDSGARRLAERPHQFRDLNNPDSFILTPSVTSERREYAPIGFFGSDVIATNLVQIIPNATQYEFALLSSQMHMDWLRLVGGRLKGDYRYSGTLVYNTFPWPECTQSQREHIESLAEEILLAREECYDWSMAEMYDPDKMPAPLLEAHKALDEAVEKLYRNKLFKDQAERQEFLLKRYQELIEQEANQ